MKITNLTNSTQDYVVGVKDGAAVTEAVRPGETRDLKVAADDPTLLARVRVSAARVEGDTRAVQRALAAPPAPPASSDKAAE